MIVDAEAFKKRDQAIGNYSLSQKAPKSYKELSMAKIYYDYTLQRENLHFAIEAYVDARFKDRNVYEKELAEELFTAKILTFDSEIRDDARIGRLIYLHDHQVNELDCADIIKDLEIAYNEGKIDKYKRNTEAKESLAKLTGTIWNLYKAMPNAAWQLSSIFSEVDYRRRMIGLGFSDQYEQKNPGVTEESLIEEGNRIVSYINDNYEGYASWNMDPAEDLQFVSFG